MEILGDAALEVLAPVFRHRHNAAIRQYFSMLPGMPGGKEVGKTPNADSEMSSRCGKQLLEDVEFRQEWAKKVGLGFDLPIEPDLVGLRGLQFAENIHRTEAA